MRVNSLLGRRGFVIRLAQEAQLRAVVLRELDEVRLERLRGLLDELFVVDDTCGHGPVSPTSLFERMKSQRINLDTARYSCRLHPPAS